ncbi:hypothetical protein TUN199_05398 [Pyrenophora tritici-repentis]|nr:hypothetical protein Alg130_08707 [Pyrenophora tritici-repentis]KAI0613240.1 hypothetical protein TUN205_02545 [Pyrenophora tritici-repentis]KAI0622626.1 hypothetical protein TUN199_05398 [Pyrenophora tritici-repentis]
MDLVVTVIFFIATIFAGYIALEFVLKALPGVVAQAFDGNCSVVYVTVPGPIITVSLVAASPTNPARGTYYFSVVNSTTRWLNSIAPPSRFSTLITRTPEITPIVSSLSATGSSFPGESSVSSTEIYTSPDLSIPGLSSSLTVPLISGSTMVSLSMSRPDTTVPLPSLSPSSPQRPYPPYPPSTGVISSVFSGSVSTLLTSTVSTSVFLSFDSSASVVPELPSGPISSASISSPTISDISSEVLPSITRSFASESSLDLPTAITSIPPYDSTSSVNEALPTARQASL